MLADTPTASAYRLTALPSRHAPTPPRATRAQVRRCVAGRFHRRPPRRRDRSPPPCRAHRRGRLRDGGDYRCAPGSGATGRERRVAHRRASLIARLRARHAEVARSLLPGGRLRADVLLYISDLFAELEALAQGLRLLRELTPRTTDYLVSRGERLSARLVAAALEAGRHPRPVRGRDRPGAHRRRFRPGGARTTPAPTAPSSESSRPLLGRGVVPVVPGFIGATPEGEVATLGRGGSDLTATLLARGLGAARVSLWKDVPGLLTADPRVVPDARVIPAAPRPRGGGARLLRRQGAPPACADPGRPGAGSRCSSALSPIPIRRGTEVSERVGAGAEAGEGAHSRRRAGARHRHRQRDAGRAGYRRPHLRRPARPADLGLTHLPGVVGALDLLQRPGAVRGRRPGQRWSASSAARSRAGRSTASR